jgi:hypothetical protein
LEEVVEREEMSSTMVDALRDWGRARCLVRTGEGSVKVEEDERGVESAEAM